MKWGSGDVVRPAVSFQSVSDYVERLRPKKLIKYLGLFHRTTKTREHMVANACNYDDSLRKFQSWEPLGVEENVKTIRISIAELLEQSFEIGLSVDATKEKIFKIARDKYNRCDLVGERDVTILENEYIKNVEDLGIHIVS